MIVIYKRSRNQLVTEIFRDPERKSIPVIVRDLIYLLLKFKELPIHYFSRYLYRKGDRNIQDFIPNSLSGKIAPYFNDGRVKQVLDNKLFFNMYYSQFGIPTPVILASNHQYLFASGGVAREIKGLHEFRDFIAALFQRNPDCDTIFVKRTYSGSSGKNVHVIHADMINKDGSTINDIFQDVKISEFVFQKKIKQHPALDRLNPSSLNTMRIDTFIDRNGKVDIISGFLKMSICNRPVDNSNQGGCGVEIDLNTGRLQENGYSKMKLTGVGILQEHPVTGVRFEGYPIPMIEEAKMLVSKAAALMPGLRLVGWDVGFTEEGPVIIEGNSDYGINASDLMFGGYFANEKFSKVISEFKSRDL